MENLKSIKLIYTSLLLIFVTSLFSVSCSKVNFISSRKASSLNSCPEAGGCTPEPHDQKTETFVQNNDSRVDILVVVDNSTSMGVEQAKMGLRMSSFFGELGDIDWQVGVTLTDVSRGPYGVKGDILDIEGGEGKFFNAKTPDLLSKFADTVSRPESVGGTDPVTGQRIPFGSGNEMPFQATMMAIDKRNTTNHGFFRSESDLIVVILSDEDENSEGTSSSTTQPIEVVNKFNSVFGDTKGLTVYALIIKPRDAECFRMQLLPSTGYYGNKINELVQMTRGVVGSICDQDFGPTLSHIGNSVRQRFESIELAFVPDKILKVSLVPEQHHITWFLEDQRIIFSEKPSEGTQIKVEYLAEDSSSLSSQ